MKIEKVSINGKIFPVTEAKIPASDHGLMYGVNAFESLRVHKGSAFLLDEHFDRLAKSLSVLKINWNDNRKRYFSWISDLCSDLPEDKDAFIRFVVTAGQSDFWVSEGEYSNPNVLIYGGSIPLYTPQIKRAVILKGVKRVKPEYFDRVGFRIKSMDYVSSRTAKLELKKTGEGLDGILLSPKGDIAEGLTSNIFWIKGGELYTPPLTEGILAGTVRSYIMSNHKTKEVLAKTEELESADEIFFTSGSGYLNPLCEINGIKKPGISGPVFMGLYHKLIDDIADKSILLQA